MMYIYRFTVPILIVFGCDNTDLIYFQLTGLCGYINLRISYSKRELGFLNRIEHMVHDIGRWQTQATLCYKKYPSAWHLDYYVVWRKILTERPLFNLVYEMPSTGVERVARFFDDIFRFCGAYVDAHWAWQVTRLFCNDLHMRDDNREKRKQNGGSLTCARDEGIN